MKLLLPILTLLGAAPAWAGPEDDAAYDRAVDLVDRLYLYPEDIDAARLLDHAARGLAERVDWLMVESDGRAVYLRHGDGHSIGSVSVATMDTLPAALRALEQLVRDSGYAVPEDVDLRVEILRGLTLGLDRYSRLLEGDKLERFDVRLKGTLVGVGATLVNVGGKLVVKKVEPGQPAERGGLRGGDVVVAIDGASTVGMPLAEATRKIRDGEVDSEVILTVERRTEDGETLVVDLILTRAEVTVPNVTHRVLDGGVGYIAIDHFSQKTDENLSAELARLRAKGGLDRGLIIDLRGNTGGSMRDAAKSADQFLESGLLLQTVGRDGGRVQNLQGRMDAVDAGTEPNVPIVVLVDERTASGSEILAGALVALDRAALVGTRTFGKGTVQKIYTLDDEIKLKLTVAKYLLASGLEITPSSATALAGLAPDAALGQMQLRGETIRFVGWQEERTGVPWAEVVPLLVDPNRAEPGTDWCATVTPADACVKPVELARRALLASRGVSRAALLGALDQASAQVRAEEEAKLVEAFTARGVDWSPAPGAPPATPPLPKVDVRVRSANDPVRRDVLHVVAEVENLGAEPLYRALVEITSDYDVWNGLVIPVGKIAPGATAQASVDVTLPPGVDAREDVVRLTLRSDRHAPMVVDDEVLRAASSELPRLALTLRYVDDADVPRAEIIARNLSNTVVGALDLSFAYPAGLDVTLLDAVAHVPSIPPRGEVRADLGLRVGDTAPALLDLTVEVRSDAHGRLAEWPVWLPVDGSPVTLEAPRVVARHIDLAAPVGPYALPLQASDEHAIDHVVVYHYWGRRGAEGGKVVWAAGGRSRVDVRADLMLQPGKNRVVVVAEDDQGVQTGRTFIIRGEPTAAVDADDD